MDPEVERLKDALGGDFCFTERNMEEWVAYGLGGEVVTFGPSELIAMRRLYERLRPESP